MGSRKSNHRPLVSAIAILNAKTEKGRIEITGSRTLTGLARRKSDKKKVLVTCLHVVGTRNYHLEATERI